VKSCGSTGIRIEELLEISHHSLIQYRLPSAGEIVPLLQIVPSKTDEEDFLVVSRSWRTCCRPSSSGSASPAGSPAVPATSGANAYGGRRRLSCSQRRLTTENRAITDGHLRRMLNAALAAPA